MRPHHPSAPARDEISCLCPAHRILRPAGAPAPIIALSSCHPFLPGCVFSVYLSAPPFKHTHTLRHCAHSHPPTLPPRTLGTSQHAGRPYHGQPRSTNACDTPIPDPPARHDKTAEVLGSHLSTPSSRPRTLAAPHTRTPAHSRTIAALHHRTNRTIVPSYLPTLVYPRTLVPSYPRTLVRTRVPRTLTPHHTALRHTTPHQTPHPPHPFTPQHTTPHHTTLQHNTTQHTTPHYTTTHHTTPHHTTDLPHEPHDPPHFTR